MKKRLWWGIGTVVVLLVLVIVGWWLIWGSARGTQKVTAGTVTSISMQEDVYATGSVAPSSRQEVRVLNPGIVSKVAVKVGDFAKAGQVLVTLDTTLADAQVAQAQAGVDAAQAAVNAAQNNLTELKRAQSSAAAAASSANAAIAGNASQSNAEVVNINGNGGGSVSNNNSSSTNVGSLSSVFEGSGAVSQAQGTLAQSQAALKQARETLHVAQVQRDQLSCKAILSGTVLEVKAQAGDLASAQEPLVVVGDLTHMNVVVQLNEMDASKVKQGEKVTVTTKTLGASTMAGVITEVAPEAAAQASLQGNASPTVGVTIRLDHVPAGLKPGYNVNIQVVVATKRGFWRSP
ncbi:efflux RND transporter periplasmic adaptor subunit [Desulfosporosinus sp. SB140]|uniref:efflux RND transporter periplasmic adaptor subunit n=1 Tax=Desulfosporosinus paludis TaxID=3115649 RepID=UPI00388D3171